MKKISLLLIIFWISSLAMAQTDPYERVITSFQLLYNEEKYDQIFEGFSQEMKQALPLKNTKQFLANLNNEVGKIEGVEYVTFQQGTYAVYKANFEWALMTINVALDDENKITGLYIKPYENLNQRGETTLDNLDGYPEEIRSIIFAKTIGHRQKKYIYIYIHTRVYVAYCLHLAESF
jgi:hypothetical protein